MSRPVIATATLSDAVTITASSSGSQTPVTNLQRIQPGDRWASTAVNPYLVLDFGTATTWNVCALLHTNTTASGQIAIRAATTEANLTASPGHSATVDNDGDAFFYWVTAGVSYRWLRFDIADGANPDGFASAGRLIVDNAYQLPAGVPQYGFQEIYTDSSERQKVLGGQTHVTAGGKAKSARLAMRFNSESEMRANLVPLIEAQGGSADMLLVRDPDIGAYRYQGIYHGLASLNTTIVHSAYGVFDITLEIEGLI